MCLNGETVKSDKEAAIAASFETRVARTTYLWCYAYLLHQLLVALAILLLGMWLDLPERLVVSVPPALSLAFLVHLWGAKVARRDKTIVVRNGTFTRSRTFSAKKMSIDATAESILGLKQGGGQDVARFVVLVDNETGRRTKVIASGLPTSKQRSRFWKQFSPRMRKQDGAHLTYK